MRQSHPRRNTVVLCTLGLVLFAVGPAGAAQSASSDPLQFVPAESLFCVRVNHLNTALNRMDQFLTGIAPTSLSMAVKSQFAQILGATEPNSIDMSADFAVFGLLPGGEAPNPSRIGVLVPVTNYQKFVKDNPDVGPPNAQGISRIGPEGEQKIIAAQVDGYALATSIANEQDLANMKSWMPQGTTSLAQRLSTDELKQATDSSAWAYANVQVVYKMFGPAIQAKMQQIKEKFKEMQAQGAPVMGNMNDVMDMYSTMLNTLMQETQSVSLSLEPSASTMRATFAAAAVPATNMAKILSEGGSQQQQQAELLGYLENGALMNVVGTPGQAFVKSMTLLRIDLLTKMAGKAMSPDDVAKLKKLATDSGDALAGPFAMSFSVDPKSKPPMKMRYVAVLKDKQKFNDVMDQAAKLASEKTFADLLEGFGLKMQLEIKKNAETYKDVPIDAIHLDIQPTDANAPQGKMMLAMFGERLDLRLAVVNNLMLYTLSADPQKAIQTLIDQAQAGGTGQVASEVQAAIQLIPDAKQAEFFGTYNYPRAIQMAMAFSPMPLPQIEISTQSNIAFDANVGDGKLVANLAVPKQQVIEMMTMFMQIQQNAQKVPQEQQGQM